MTKKFPKLFKLTSTGEKQAWEIIVIDDSYRTKYGRVGGTETTSEPTICKGKNIGRANETTPQEQAVLEAQAEWTKKQKKGGYVLSLEAAEAGEVSSLVKGGVWPLLAQHYKDNVKNAVWPCYAQRKLNGHRCIAVIDDAGKATLWSRARMPILSVPHIIRALEALGLKSVMFDGELYDYEFVRDNGLEAFNHLVKRASPIPGHEVVKYWIYDAPIQEKSQMQRFLYLDDNLGKSPALPLVRVETRIVKNIEEAMAFLGEAMEDDFEGIMLRRPGGLYLGHPTHHTKELLKLKGIDGKSEDAEFKVIGVKEGKKGKMIGKAIFICETKDGKTFDAKMKGPLTKLQHYWEHPEEVIGKMMTVQFQGWTNKGVPWFPRALQPRVDL
jgi:DNA ligase-1